MNRRPTPLTRTPTRTGRVAGVARGVVHAVVRGAICGVLCGGVCGLGSACVTAPDVVLTDQKTALERQAAGEFRALENDLGAAGISTTSEPLTREALEAKNPDLSKSTLGEVAQLYSAVLTDAAWIDQLLVAGCIGEARDGLLQRRPDGCDEEVDTGQLTRVVERSNLHRRQLWRLIAQRDANASAARIRDTWRRIHLQRVVCGASVEGDDGSWEKKEC